MDTEFARISQDVMGPFYNPFVHPRSTRPKRTLALRHHRVPSACAYNDKIYSPNQFCRLIAGNARDAWRDLYIQRPTDEWVVADRLRQEGKAKHQAYVATARGNVIELGQHQSQ